MTRRRKRVYIAGPYSSEPWACTHRAMELATAVLDAGYAPLLPHLTHFWHTSFPRAYEDWLELDLAWVAVAQAVLRIPGDSRGADREVALAESLSISVFHSLDELVERMPP